MLHDTRLTEGGGGVKSYLGNAHMETTHIINGLPLSVYIANVDVKSMINVSHWLNLNLGEQKSTMGSVLPELRDIPQCVRPNTSSYMFTFSLLFYTAPCFQIVHLYTSGAPNLNQMSSWCWTPPLPSLGESCVSTHITTVGNGSTLFMTSGTAL